MTKLYMNKIEKSMFEFSNHASLKSTNISTSIPQCESLYIKEEYIKQNSKSKQLKRELDGVFPAAG